MKPRVGAWVMVGWAALGVGWLWAQAPPRAPDSGVNDVVGTVELAGPGLLTVGTEDGRAMELRTGPRTRVHNGRRSLPEHAVRAGHRVRARYRSAPDGGHPVATEVELVR